MTFKRTKDAALISVALPGRSLKEEIANSLIHALGVFLAIAGLTLLVLKAAGPLDTAACVVYASALILMFLASTLYHGISNEALKQLFRVLDHSAIYLLIAGTYTPFCLLGLQGAWGWTLFAIEWTLALSGIVLHACNIKALKKIEVAVYLIMGWAVVAGWMPLIRQVNRESIVLLISGGAAYTIGALFYRLKSRPGAHVVWHVFVLAGAVCHWFAVWFLA
jgi:hemolysin III